MKKEEKEAENLYNKIAESYHYFRTKKYPEGWFYNELLEMPATFELLGNLKGKKVLDFGCGTGIYAKRLIKKGAKVKGFDLSFRMLEIAKRENPKLELKQGSGYKIPFNEKFDIVVAPLILDYLIDWNKVFREVSRVLKKGGYFIFSLGNPVCECFTNVFIKNKKYKVFGKDYFEEKPFYNTWNLGGEKVKVVSHHKTYETIIKTIIKNGFEIVDYKDTFPLKKAKRLFPSDYKQYSKQPYFCVWKVRKKLF